MRTIKLTLAYDGTAYAGWQWQAGQRTLQGELEAALARVSGESIRITASGRTDAGVHALGQVVSFQLDGDMPSAVLQKALNAELPDDMAVLEVADARENFHAIRAAIRKRYRYVINDGRVRDVFRRQYAWHYRRRLDTDAMQRAASVLVGTHDFRSFETTGSERSSSIRTVYEISVARAGRGSPDLVTVEIEADGFLYNMVRSIVGTLVEVGRGVRTEVWPAEVLAARDRRAAGMTAPAQGLFLVSVQYEQ